MNIAERYIRLQNEVKEELRACGRTGDVALVAVSKKQPASAILEAVVAGVTDIGENYVQEAIKKFEVLDSSDAMAGELVRKHFIGHIQTNKAKAIVEAFDIVQSVDRVEAGQALANAAARAGKRLPILVQVNVSLNERFGVAPAKVEKLAEQLRGFDSLVVEGVMAIGPFAGDRAEIMRAFELAAKTLGLVGGSTLSIGMSGDWREAVRAGSTMIRIGTAIFGERRAALLQTGESE
jgi:pyridoxal phosphate enzyme (YggS family)